MIVTHEQAKALGYCNAGLRKWFATQDVTFEHFRRHGVSTEWLASRNNAMADRLIEYATAQAAEQQRST